MTRKEYQELLDQHVIYSGYDFLTPEEVTRVKREARKAVKNGAEMLQGCNGKAYVEKAYKSNTVLLISYETVVAEYSPKEGFKKRWNGYSATTMKHINAFCKFLGIPGYSKHEWVALETV